MLSFLSFPLVFSCLFYIIAACSCGPEATSWFARQLDLLRNRSDNSWVGADLYSNVLNQDASSASFYQGLMSSSVTSSSCPGVCSECVETLTVCNTCMSKDTFAMLSYG